MDFEDYYKQYAKAAREKDNYWLLVNQGVKVDIPRPDANEVRRLEAKAVQHFFEERNLDSGNYEEYLKNGIENALMNMDFVKMKFIIELARHKEIEDFQKVFLAVNAMFEKFATLYEEDRKFITPHFYVLEQLIDLLPDYPFPQLIKPIESLCHLTVFNNFGNIRTCISKAFTILYEIGTKEAFAVIKQCVDHADDEVKEKAMDIIANWEVP